MKKIWLLIVTLLISTVSIFAQGGPKFKFFDKNDTYHFGTVTDGEKVVHEFEFENVGTAPLVIFAADVTCGCTTTSFSKSPVMPGKKGSIKVTFDSTDKVGATTREIYIKSNAPLENKKTHYVLTLQGTVKAK